MGEIGTLYKPHCRIQKSVPQLREHLASPEKVKELELGHRSQFSKACKSV